MLQGEPVTCNAIHGLLQQWQRLLRITRKEVRNAEQAQRLRIARCARDDVLTQTAGGAEIAALQIFLGLFELAIREGGHRSGRMPREESPPMIYVLRARTKARDRARRISETKRATLR